MIQYTVMNSPVGKLLLAQSKKGLNHIIFEYQIHKFESIVHKKYPNQPIERNNAALQPVVDQLKAYFSGERNTFNLNLDLVMPPFQMDALNVVKQIPYGSYLTYKEVAERAGNPKAVRAVGSANAHNPLPIVVPCHRVLATGGGLGGYGGGLDMKNYLLNLEGTL